jgi:hypothetical protein
MKSTPPCRKLEVEPDHQFTRFSGGLIRTARASWVVGCTLCAVLSCVDRRPPGEATPELRQLTQWLTGSFSSRRQAADDSSFFDIRLEMVPIWTERTDGFWLYIEQASASSLGQPYRQRVYHLTQDDDSTFRSDVYTLPEPLRFAGAWREAAPLSGLAPDSLALREGCSILMYPEGRDAFAGGTVGHDCESRLRGARYATSEVRVTATGLYSWDRGFDSTGQQMWGARKGGYIFDRVEPAESL